MHCSVGWESRNQCQVSIPHLAISFHIYKLLKWRGICNSSVFSKTVQSYPLELISGRPILLGRLGICQHNQTASNYISIASGLLL